MGSEEQRNTVTLPNQYYSFGKLIEVATATTAGEAVESWLNLHFKTHLKRTRCKKYQKSENQHNFGGLPSVKERTRTRHQQQQKQLQLPLLVPLSLWLRSVAKGKLLLALILLSARRQFAAAAGKTETKIETGKRSAVAVAAAVHSFDDWARPDCSALRKCQFSCTHTSTQSVSFSFN